jgi:predicted dehydrogenase
MRFAMVGAGAIAQTYARVFETSETAQLVVVADTRRESAEAIADWTNCVSYSDYKEMAEREAFDAVVVCTPPNSHAEICCDFLERGIHVLCEKPLAINVQQAEDMLSTARRANVTLAMASKYRFVDDVVRAKSLIASGTIGDVLLLENTFAARIDMSQRWNTLPEVSGGGVLIDNGTHSVDICRYLLGPIVELQAIEGRRTQSACVEDTAWLFVRNETGAQGAIHLSWSTSKELPYYICICGTAGTLQVGWRGSKYRRWSDDQWISFGNGYDKLEAFSLQIDNFVRSIRGEEELLIRPHAALASVEVIEVAYRAMQAGGWQKVNNGKGAGARRRTQLSEDAKDALS